MSWAVALGELALEDAHGKLAPYGRAHAYGELQRHTLQVIYRFSQHARPEMVKFAQLPLSLG